MNENTNQEKGSISRLKLDHGELSSTGFWVGQLLMILATVVGVYLAAEQGLTQAIRYNQYDDIQQNYYLRLSLYDEVSDNVKLLRNFDQDYLSKSAPDTTLVANRPAIGTYVWDTMQFSPHTLQTPNLFFSAIRRFYRKSESILDRAVTRKLGASYASQLLRAELQIMDKDVLPKLDLNSKQLASQLKQDFNIDIP